MRSLLVIGLVTTALLCTNPTANATYVWGSPKETAEQSTVVFAGVVESVTEHESPCVYRIEYVFQVSQVWKGPLRVTFSVYTSNRAFEIGKHYMVYATALKWCGDSLVTRQTDRPQLIENALYDRVVLGKANVVNAYTAVPVPSESEIRAVLNSGRFSYQAQEALDALQEQKAARESE